MDVRQQVGMNVRRLRLEANQSQETIAAGLGVDRSYMSGLELGRRNPTVLTLWHLARALKVDIREFFADVDPDAIAGRKKRRESRSDRG